MLVAIFGLGTGFLLGYVRGRADGYWKEVAGDMGFSRIMIRAGLTEEGERVLNELTDIVLYSYFVSDSRPRQQYYKKQIQESLVELINWKLAKGHSIGPQEPLVSLQMTDGDFSTTAHPSEFNIFKTRLEEFLKAHEELIQPSP